MSDHADREAEARKNRLRSLLDVAESRSQPIRFWWRDDDARTATPELGRLFELTSEHRVPLGLAVVPDGATASLAASIEAPAQIAVLQHGWRHARHNPAGERKAELGDHRPASIVLEELRKGRAVMRDLFPRAFLPVLVPPWNRIGDEVRARRGEVGLIGLSLFGRKRTGDSRLVNTHLDLIDWQTRGSIGQARAYAILCDEVERRLDGDAEPVGLLTHHLAQDRQTWKLLEELLDLLARHTAVRWPPVAELFGLATGRSDGALTPARPSTSPP